MVPEDADQPTTSRAILICAMPAYSLVHSDGLAPPEPTLSRQIRHWKAFFVMAVGFLTLLGACHHTAEEPVPTPPLEQPWQAHFELIRSGQPGPARIRLRQAIDAGEEDSRALFLMGLSHHWERRYGLAEKWFEQAALASPTYPPAMHFLGWARYHTGNAHGSEQAFRQHLQMQPQEGDSHFALGVIALERGDLELADLHFIRAIELQRHLPERQDGVGKALARRAEVVQAQGGPLNEAAALLQEAVTLDADLYEAYFNLARILRRLNRMDEADAAEMIGFQTRSRLDAQRGRPR